jgi:hypothetical protein
MSNYEEVEVCPEDRDDPQGPWVCRDCWFSDEEIPAAEMLDHLREHHAAGDLVPPGLFDHVATELGVLCVAIPEETPQQRKRRELMERYDDECEARDAAREAARTGPPGTLKSLSELLQAYWGSRGEQDMHSAREARLRHPFACFLPRENDQS